MASDTATHILKSYVPGYPIISRFLLDDLGVDITIILYAGLMIYVLSFSWKVLTKQVLHGFRSHFTSFVAIDSDDSIYDHVTDWLCKPKDIHAFGPIDVQETATERHKNGNQTLSSTSAIKSSKLL